jgi:hypothetical protein
MKKNLLLVTLSLAFLMSFPLAAQDSRKDKGIIVEESTLPELNVVNNILYVKNAPIGKNVEIFTIIGSKEREIEMKATVVTHELNLPKGIYIFKLDGVVRKFVIK